MNTFFSLRTYKKWIYIIFALSIPLTIFFPIAPPVAKGIFSFYVTPGIYITDILVGLLVLTLLLPIRTQHKPTPPLNFVLILCLFFAFLNFLSIQNALSQPFALYSSLRLAFLFLVGSVFLKFSSCSNQFIFALLISLVINFVIGVLQMIYQQPLGIPFELALPPFNPRTAFLYLPGIKLYRPYGLTFHPNVFGGLMTSGFLLSFRLPTTTIIKTIRTLLLAGILLSFSRSAWLALGITMLPILYHKIKSRRMVLSKSMVVSGFILIIGVIFFAPFISNRLDIFRSTSEKASLIGRGQMIQIALKAIQDHPLTGIGSGNFPIFMSQYNTTDLPQFVHNSFFLFASENGIFAGLIWLLLLLAPIFLFLKEKTFDMQVYPFIAAWIALGLISLWDNYPVTLENVRLLMVFLFVMIMNHKTMKAEYAPVPDNKNRKRL